MLLCIALFCVLTVVNCTQHNYIRLEEEAVQEGHRGVVFALKGMFSLPKNIHYP